MKRPLGARPWLEWIVDTIADALDFGRETGMYKHDVEPAAPVASETVNQQVGAHAFSCPGRAPAQASRLLTGAGRAARLALPVRRRRARLARGDVRLQLGASASLG